uniref:PPC domain-containing protein n=1 Tax=Agrilutibacter solisilvae TaxID=2763317 RepID=UPI00387E241D
MPIAVSVPAPKPELANGVPVTGLSGAIGSQTHYRLEVPAGATSVTFQLAGGTGDADIFVKRGTEASQVVFDCASANAANNETCTINAPQAGTWYVNIVAFAAYSGTTLTGSYQ